MKKYNLEGKRVGRLTVDSFFGVRGKYRMWKCICDCGNTVILSTSSLNSDKTHSCGCLRHENSKDRIKYTGDDRILYHRWKDMIRRCTDQNYQAYCNYGGRGIKVCDEWMNDFLSYRNWAMENGFRPELSIDRIDNDGNYEPSNCKWATEKEQANNRRTNRLVKIGNDTKTLTEWCEEYNIDFCVAQSRLDSGWDAERALSEPLHIEKRKKSKRGRVDGTVQTSNVTKNGH